MKTRIRTIIGFLNITLVPDSKEQMMIKKQNQPNTVMSKLH